MGAEGVLTAVSSARTSVEASSARQRWRTWWPTLVVAIVVTAYLPLLVATYGFSDDYFVTRAFQQDRSTVVRAELGNARPVMVALHWAASLFVDDVSGLRWLRLLSILGLAALGVRIATLAQQAGRSTAVSFALGLGVVVLPPAQVAASWSIMWVVPVAALAAVQAAAMADRGRVAVPILLLVGAMLTYQPAAMCYWLPLVIAVDRARSSRDVARHAAVLATTAVTGGLVWFFSRGLALTEGRSQLTHDPLGQAEWFLTYVLPRALSPAPISTPPLVTLALFAFLMGGIALAERRDPRRLAFLLAVIPATYATSLIVDHDIPSARSMFALAPVLLVLYVHAGKGWLEVLPALARPAPAAAVLLAVTLAAAAGRSVHVYFADPQQREWQRVEQSVARSNIQPHEYVEVAQADWNHYLAPAKSLDEFGMLSTTFPWVPVPIVELARREHTGQWSGRTRLVRAVEPGVLDLDAVVRDQP
jgi:hypothetical protein